MANVAFLENGNVVYLKSVNTPEYSGKTNLVINPDVSSLSVVDRKYWKIDGGSVVEMTQAEKDFVNESESLAKDAAVQNLTIDTITLAKALVKAGVVTKQNLVTAIKEVI
jgi:hypothetical protein